MGWTDDISLPERMTPATSAFSRAMALVRSAPGATTLVLELLQRGAAQGDPRAQYALGNWHVHGIGVRKTFRRAAGYFECAVRAAHANAAHDLAVCFATGKGRSKELR